MPENEEVVPGPAPEPASSAPDRLQEMQAKALEYLDKIDPVVGDDAEDAEWERAAGEPDDDEPEAEAEATNEEPETAEVVAEEEETPDGEEGETPDADGDAEYTRAIEALRRNGWTDGDFKALSRERVLSLGLKQAKRQDDYNATFAEIRRLKSEHPKSEEAAAGSERTVESSAPPAGLPLKDAIAKFKDALGLEGEDGDEALTQFAGAVVAPLMQRLEESQQALSVQGQAAFSTATRIVRDDLLGDFPGLKEADFFQKTLAELDKLNPDAYEGDPISRMRSAMFDAASMVERRLAPKERARRSTKPSRAKGTATPPGHRRVDDTAPKSAFERASSLLDDLERKHGVT